MSDSREEVKNRLNEALGIILAERRKFPGPGKDDPDFHDLGQAVYHLERVMYPENRGPVRKGGAA